MRKLTFLLLTTAFLFTACDKNKRASKHLMKAGNWEVKELSVDGVSQTLIPTWEIKDCDIYETVCEGTWTSDTTQSRFYWQFNDKAQTFTISRVVAPEDCEDFYTEEVEQQTFKFSGEYDVTKNKRKSKTFESYNTLGFEGQKAVIRVEKG
ncbi:hypothetical protein [Brumimicrobium aurantiacum]|uniref:Lipocalin-like domain-containing protein n=1 Tax=Brumimicrobium aurantiacum TaxID=1737063 RepID=A0A3E1EXB2_9FLAO|nr:hypothetical protein [Brumimicrobium aurantiacum]RFC54162.1 hypothetical protein DXU93_09250 [Brumimicrobium aurantiacum]